MYINQDLGCDEHLIDIQLKEDKRTIGEFVIYITIILSSRVIVPNIMQVSNYIYHCLGLYFKTYSDLSKSKHGLIFLDPRNALANGYKQNNLPLK